MRVNNKLIKRVYLTVVTVLFLGIIFYIVTTSNSIEDLDTQKIQVLDAYEIQEQLIDEELTRLFGIRSEQGWIKAKNESIMTTELKEIMYKGYFDYFYYKQQPRIIKVNTFNTIEGEELYYIYEVKLTTIETESYRTILIRLDGETIDDIKIF